MAKLPILHPARASVARLAAILTLVGLSALAATPPVSIEWTAPLPCDALHAKLAPGQPALGLSLYRFECPGQPARYVSAKRVATASAFALPVDLARGDVADPGQAQPAGTLTAHRESDLPLAPEQLGGMQARRLLPAGTPLLAKDFEPRTLWIGGETVSVVLRQGAVSATLSAAALGVGRHGQRASVKLDNGRTLSGLATLRDGAPVLLSTP